MLTGDSLGFGHDVASTNCDSWNISESADFTEAPSVEYSKTDFRWASASTFLYWLVDAGGDGASKASWRHGLYRVTIGSCIDLFEIGPR